MALAQSNRILGLTPAVFIFDFRDKAPNDVANDLRRIGRNHPEAEILVVAEAQGAAAFAACLQIIGAPEKLTFLLAPLHRQLAVETIRTVARRHQDDLAARQASDKSRSAEAAQALQIQELRARLDIAKHAARHDDLTGALNRTGFVEELTARLARDRQSQNVLMIDLDRFKAVNDTLGHSAGDDLVRKICTGIQSVIPSDAVLARLGGDEFGVVVEGATDVGNRQHLRPHPQGLRPDPLHPRSRGAGHRLHRRGAAGRHAQRDGADAPGRPRPLRRQAGRQEPQPHLRLGARHGDQAPPFHRERAGAGASGRRAQDGLPAHRQRGQRQDPGLRGPDPLGQPGARLHLAHRIHSRRRGDRSDPGHRRLDHPSGAAGLSPVERRLCLDQSLHPPVPAPQRRRTDPALRRRGRRLAAADPDRADGKPPSSTMWSAPTTT